MEPIKFAVQSRFSEFKKVYTDFLSDTHNIHGRCYTSSNIEYRFQHSFNGVLFICKVTVVDNGTLDIEIPVPVNPNENSEIHINYIVEEIKGKFFTAKLPVGFKNLISDNGYVSIMEERWRESERTQRAEAWLATIVMLGSILEGILLYKIQNNKEQSNRTYKTVKNVSTAKLYKDWTLDDMINVCHKCGWISRDAKGFSDGVKEYRNFVHPWKQLENNLDMPTEKTCRLSRNVIEDVLDDLWKSV